jgi:hypothetical protein
MNGITNKNLFFMLFCLLQREKSMKNDKIEAQERKKKNRQSILAKVGSVDSCCQKNVEFSPFSTKPSPAYSCVYLENNHLNRCSVCN